MSELPPMNSDAAAERLRDVQGRLDAKWKEHCDLQAERSAIINACTHLDGEGHPTIDRSHHGDNGWCRICLKGVALDERRRPVGPWR